MVCKGRLNNLRNWYTNLPIWDRVAKWNTFDEKRYMNEKIKDGCCLYKIIATTDSSLDYCKYQYKNDPQCECLTLPRPSTATPWENFFILFCYRQLARFNLIC